MFLGVFILASCEKDPNYSDLDEDFIVITKYDDTYTNSFKTNAGTYYISDTITLISSDAVSPKWSDPMSKELIDRVKSNLAAFGYTYVPYDQIQDVDGNFTPRYLVTMTAVKDMETVIYSWYPYWYDYYYPSYWWWGGYYPYYPYWPYMTGYTYNVGTTLIHMIDMQVVPNSSSTAGGHPIRWNAILNGLLDTGNDKMFEEEAIDQAFDQSAAYLNRNAK